MSNTDGVTEEDVIHTRNEMNTLAAACEKLNLEAAGEKVFHQKKESALKNGNTVLEKVPYSPAAHGIDPQHIQYTLANLHSFTNAEMRSLLERARQPSRGTKRELRKQIRRYYRKEFANLSKKSDFMPVKKNKTAMHFDYLIALDFECTCVEIIYDYPHEIIEFPAVLIDVESYRIVDTFRTFVRPVINPVLDDFCKDLCHISQEQVDQAPLFPGALELFYSWMAHHDLSNKRYAFVTDGPHDLWKFFQFQCMQSGITQMPHEFRYFVNIKRTFENCFNKRERLTHVQGESGIQHMLRHFKLEFSGSTHCGLDDAKNIARIAIEMMHRKVDLRVNQRVSHKMDRTDDKPLIEVRGDNDFQVWYRKLPLKLRSVSREEFLSGEYRDCDSCDED